MLLALQILGLLGFTTLAVFVFYMGHQVTKRENIRLTRLDAEQKEKARGNFRNEDIKTRLNSTWAYYEDQKYPWKLMFSEALSGFILGLLIVLVALLIYHNNHPIKGFWNNVAGMIAMSLWMFVGGFGGFIVAYICFFIHFKIEDQAERKRLKEAEMLLNETRRARRTS